MVTSHAIQTPQKQVTPQAPARACTDSLLKSYSFTQIRTLTGQVVGRENCVRFAGLHGGARAVDVQAGSHDAAAHGPGRVVHVPQARDLYGSRVHTAGGKPASIAGVRRT
jgi:hypothetical protein